MVYSMGDKMAADFFEAGYILKLEKKNSQENVKNVKDEELKTGEEKIYNNLEEKSKILQ